MNNTMNVNKLPTIEHYWCNENYIGNRSVMTKSRFKEILHNTHFSDNDTPDSNNKGNKVRPLTDHFNEAFQTAMGHYPSQNTDEHMTKFKRTSSIKQ